MFDGVIGSLLNGLPSWSTTLPRGLHMDTWIATAYKLTGYTPWIYTVIIPNVCHKLFDSVCAFNFRCHHTLTVYYHHLTVTVIAVIRLTGYATLLFARYASFAPFIFTLRPSLTV